MDCTQVRKFLYAFADGQLGVKDNCVVLDHLKMCAACGRVVEEHQTLRTSLKRSAEQVPIPAGLDSRVRQALVTGRPVKRAQPAPLFFRVRTFAMAACIGLVLVAAWQFGLLGIGAEPAGDDFIRVRPGVGAAERVADVHEMCCEHHAEHQASDLPRGLRTLASAITAHFDGRITALAPDLSRHGFSFESANFCGVRKREDCDRGGHLLYRTSDASGRLSLFNVPRWDCLDADGRQRPGDDGLKKYIVHRSGRPDLRIVAWHQDTTSYIFCGESDAGRMVDMARDVRVALANHPALRAFFAAARAPSLARR